MHIDSDDPKPIPALSRGLRALNVLARAGESGVTFSELGHKLEDLPAPTLSRLLKALGAEGYIVKNSSGLYVSGPQLQELSRALGAGGSIEEIALDAMNTYARETGESIGFARFYGDRLVMVEKVEVPDSFKLATLGYVFAVAVNEGPSIVVAAHLSGTDLRNYINSPESRIESRVQFRKAAASARKTGYRLEPMPHRPARGGPRRLCVAVLDDGGNPVGELHSVFPNARMASDSHRLVSCICKAAEKISARLSDRD